MKTYNVIAKALSIKTVGHSYYGNPTKEVSFESVESGEYYRGRTALNSACAYGIGYYSEGRIYNITYHFTAKGNLIIDYMNEERPDKNKLQRVVFRSQGNDLLAFFTSCRYGNTIFVYSRLYGYRFITMEDYKKTAPANKANFACLLNPLKETGYKVNAISRVCKW